MRTNLCAVAALLLTTSTSSAGTFELTSTIDSPLGLSSNRFGRAVSINVESIFVDDGAGFAEGVDQFDADTGDFVRTIVNPLLPLGTTFVNTPFASTEDFLAIGYNRGFGNPDGAIIYDAGTGGLLRSLVDPTPNNNFNNFGRSIAINSKYTLVGDTSQDGEVHVFSTSTGSLVRTIDNPDSANGFATSFGTDVALIGEKAVTLQSFEVFGTGELFVHDISSGDLLANPAHPTGGRYGAQLAVSEDFLAVSDGLESFVYVYDLSSGELLRTIEPESTLGNFALAIDGDGVLLVGDSGNSSPVNGESPQGQTFLYDAATGDLLQQFATVSGSNTDLFGGAVALGEGVIAIGAPLEEINGAAVGRVHLYSTIVPEPSAAGLALCCMAALIPLYRR